MANSAMLGTPNKRDATPESLSAKVRRLLASTLHLREIGVLAALILIGIFLTASTPYFLTTNNLLNISRQMVIISIMAVGLTYLIISREFDLSVGSTYGLSGIIAGTLVLKLGVDIWVAVPIVLVLGVLVGLINGLMVTKIGIPSFIVTLGTLSVLRGFALVLANGWPISDLPESSFFNVFAGSILGIPTHTIWMIVILLIGGFVLSRTVFGYHIYATGGNPRAARLMGINTDQVKIINFVITATLASLSGLLTLGFLNSVTPTAGTGLELDIIASVVIGGTALAGGAGSILGTFLGAAIMSTVRNGLVLLGVSAYWQQAAIGLVIVIAVTVDVLSTRRNRAE
jgi:ribose/xylose/arabinose/galactoside ABC-type transport system permease subunit